MPLLKKRQDQNGIIVPAPPTNALQMPQAPPPLSRPSPYAVPQPPPPPAQARVAGGRMIFGTFLVLALIAVGMVLASRFTSMLEDKPNSDKVWHTPPMKLAADGVSNLPGGSARVDYAASKDLIEYSQDANEGAGVHDGANWTLATRAAGGKQPRNAFTMTHIKYEPQLTSAPALMGILDVWDRDAQNEAGRPVSRRHVAVDGHDAYRWRFRTRDGKRVTQWLVPGVVHTYGFRCQMTKRPPRAIAEICADLDRAVTFKTRPERIPGT
jgi:hypothetical protein